MIKIKSKFIVAIFFSIFFFLFTCISFSRFYSLQIFYYDFGIFGHILWQLSRFEIPIISHRVLGDIVFLGDHFNPSLVILAPLFWLTTNIKILLFEQALVTVGMGTIIFLIARKLRFSYIPSMIFSFVFLLFAGVENPLVTDWHPESTAGFFVLLFFYLFSFTKYKKLGYLSALIFLGFKESNALTFIFLLIWMYFLNQINNGAMKQLNNRKIWNTKRREIVLLGLFSLLWFFLTTKFFIPFFSHQSYMYSPELPKTPVQFITNYFNNPLKTKLIFDSFISFGFLPLFSLIGLIPVILELGIRLIPNSSIFQSINLTFHYNVYLGIFLALSTIYGVKNIQNNYFIAQLFHCFKITSNRAIEQSSNYLVKVLLIYLLLISLYTARKITNSPINFAVSKIFWQELKPRNDVFNDLKLVPKQGSVMSQNNLLPLFIQRKEKLMFLKEDYITYKPDIIVLDLTSGQNPNNFWDVTYETAIEIEGKLSKDKSYKRIKTKNKNIFIFSKLR